MDGSEIDKLPASGGAVLGRGAAIGRYVVLGLVGRGGMGDVYAAYDPELDRKVAVKLVRTGRQDRRDPTGGRVRMLREAQAIARLSHPNVIVVFDVGPLGDGVFIAMEYVEGSTLSFWTQSAKRSWRELLETFRAAGCGLAAAHAAGIVHRDFKPDNVLVGRDGQVRVMDFGLARQVWGGTARRLPTVSSAPAAPEGVASAPDDDEDLFSTVNFNARHTPPELTGSSERPFDSKLTQTGAALGTPAYMAPEQFIGGATDARSDQFSFCVALFEALYGVRPFAGKTLEELRGNVLAGVVAETPAEAKVPSWLRRILLRGLRADPEERYPSMEALLAALSHDPTKALTRRLAFASAALLAVSLGSVGGLSYRTSHTRPTLCGAGPQKLNGVWEVEAPAAGRGRGESARKHAIRAAFVATGKSYADGTFARVRQILDRYVAAWSTMYTDSCEATHLRGEQSAQVLDLRMDCLADRLGRVKALTDVFASANDTVVENAVSAAGALPAIERCADVKLLRAVLPVPDDSSRVAVEAMREEIARVRALGDSGQCLVGAAAGKKLVTDAERLGYGPLEAQAHNALGRFGNECIDPPVAAEHYKKALWAAEASHDDESAAEAAVLLAHLLEGRLGEPAAAMDWIQLGQAILRRLGSGQSRIEIWALQVLGDITSQSEKPDEALALYQRALELEERTLGPDHPEVAGTLNNVAIVLQDAGRLPESIRTFERAVALNEKILGPDNPKVALVVANEGDVLNDLHRYEEALPLNQRALAIWAGAHTDPFYVAYGTTNVGESLLGLDQARRAASYFEEAIRLYQSSHTPFYPQARFGLARALWATKSERARAGQLALAARTDYQRSKISSRKLAELQAWLDSHGLAAGSPTGGERPRFATQR
jgi:eukaryotic-like serine/threonine-protein kinase